jgi:ubiquitin-like 1-activating enzyme E1 B
MEDMWKVPGRTKPVPLDYETIMDGSFVTPPLAKQSAAVVSSTSSSANQEKAQVQSSSDAPKAQGKLKDQQELTIKQNLELFLER